MVTDSTGGAGSSAAAGDGFEPVADLTAAVVTGLKWQIVTQVVNEGTRIVVVVVVARLLTPGDYGVAAMAIVCASFASVLTDPSLGLALMRRPRITEADRSTVFWAMFAIGAVSTVAGVALSGVIADIFGQPEVQKLFAVLSLGFVISTVSVTQIALMNRDLAFRKLQIRQMGAIVTGGAVSVTVALMGFGPWAIIGNQLAYTTASTVLVWHLSPWRPRVTFSRASLRELGGFGSKIYVAEMLGWSQNNADNALVGRFLGSAALGAYSLAYNVMYVPILRIAAPLMQVLSPTYARLQGEPERLERVWLKSKRVSAALLTPMFVGGAVVAPDLIPVVFGAKWHAAIVPLQLLCVAGLAQALVTLNWSVLSAQGKAGSILYIQIVNSAVTLCAFVAGLQFGIIGVAGFFAASRWLLVLIEIWMTTNAVRFSFWAALRTGTENLPYGLAAAAAAFGLRALLVGEHVPAAIRLVAAGTTVLAVYAALVLLFSPSIIAELRDVLRRRRAPTQPD
jgi:O-antigen/teichoic acid export membrane protein